MQKVQSKFITALRSGDPKKLVTVVEEIVGRSAVGGAMVGPSKLTALIKLDEQEKALEYATEARQDRI